MHDLKWILNDEKQTKRVRFATNAIEHTFYVGYNGSTVPSDKVPGVGLHGPCVSTTSVPVQDKPSCVMRYNASDRLFFLKRAGLDANHVMHLCVEQTQLQISRKHIILEEYIARNKRKHGDCSPASKRICLAH
ncbi:hypothetical protein THRCLA_20643 [Thraustotheca clavata]|uniref:Uncharacterized protein n=1 Tax=Thraustotheca clavata TaxID=74557 RepID=A0A1W0A4Z6_9STRA|nr:hypothetical protein THRCLA_20643 [Thraustotheca clavata]